MKQDTDKTEVKKDTKKEVKKVKPKRTAIVNGRVIGAGQIIKE